MSVVAARCTNCKSKIQVDDSRDAAICPCCGEPFVVEKAIRDYRLLVTSGPDFEIVGNELRKYKGSSPYIRIPEIVTKISKEAFMDNSDVHRVWLPESAIEIKEQAFCNCRNLEYVGINNGMIRIHPHAFERCGDLKIGWPYTWQKKDLTRLEIAAAYCDNAIISITPASVTTLTNHFLELLYLGYEDANGSSPATHSFIWKYHYESKKPGIDDKLTHARYEKPKLEKLLNFAGIHESTIKVISMPTDKKKYVRFAGKWILATVRMEVLQIQLNLE